jgi:hypothetical protein
VAREPAAERRPQPAHNERVVDGFGGVLEGEPAVEMRQHSELHPVVAVRALDVEPILPAGGHGWRRRRGRALRHRRAR